MHCQAKEHGWGKITVQTKAILQCGPDILVTIIDKRLPMPLLERRLDRKDSLICKSVLLVLSDFLLALLLGSLLHFTPAQTVTPIR